MVIMVTLCIRIHTEQVKYLPSGSKGNNHQRKLQLVALHLALVVIFLPATSTNMHFTCPHATCTVWWVYLYKLCMPIMASSSRFIFLCAAQLHNSDSPCVLLVSLCSPKEHNLHDLVEYIYAVTYRPFKPFSPPKFLARSVPCMCLHLVLKQLGWVEQ